MAESPLSEASPDSLEELFSRDPLDLTDRDLDRIVAELRAKRHLWTQEQATKPERKSKVARKELDLEDFL